MLFMRRMPTEVLMFLSVVFLFICSIKVVISAITGRNLINNGAEIIGARRIMALIVGTIGVIASLGIIIVFIYCMFFM